MTTPQGSAPASPRLAPRRCRACGREFFLTPQQPGFTQHCKECVAPMKRCAACGKEFRAPRNARHRRYCSLSCGNRGPEARAKLTALNERKRARVKAKVCPVCGVTFVKPGHPQTKRCSRECFLKSPECGRGGRLSKGKRCEDDRVPMPPPPTPGQIAERCAEVRAGWSEEERLERLRPDWRPLLARPRPLRCGVA